MSGWILQLFLYINVFVIGIITAVAVRHAIAHFRPQPEEKAKPTHPPVHLPPAMKAQLIELAQTKFKAILENSADEFEDDLRATSAKLSAELRKMGTDTINTEMKRYRLDMEDLRRQSNALIMGVKEENAKHQAELKTRLTEHEIKQKVKLTKEIAAEKARLAKEIDDKLSDAVASFLIETLGHNVDLGAQTAYLTAQLEEHKAEISKGIKDEDYTTSK